eukprot:6355178-Prymnesium_polylepis.1
MGFHLPEAAALEACARHVGPEAAAATAERVAAAEAAVPELAAAQAKAHASAEGPALLRANNATGFKGVYHDGIRFRAQRCEGAKTISLGRFSTAEAAALAYAWHAAAARADGGNLVVAAAPPATKGATSTVETPSGAPGMLTASRKRPADQALVAVASLSKAAKQACEETPPARESVVQQARIKLRAQAGAFGAPPLLDALSAPRETQRSTMKIRFFACSSCGKEFTKESFTRKQMKTPRAWRKCRACTKPPPAAFAGGNPATLVVAPVVRERKPSEQLQQLHALQVQAQIAHVQAQMAAVQAQISQLDAI